MNSKLRLKPILSNNYTIDNGVGSQLRISQVFRDGTKQYIQILKAFEDNLFFGLFDVEDADFEIIVDNRYTNKTIRYDTKIGNYTKGFIVQKGRYAALKALETYGKHFHFSSQDTPQAKLAIAMNAAQNGISLSEAEINCSRIEFTFTVHKDPNQVIVQKPMKRVCKEFNNYRSKGQTINVFIRMNAKTTLIRIGSENSLEDLMVLFEEREHIPPEKQRYIFCGKQLSDNNKSLKDHNIVNNSTLHLVLSLNGGGVSHKLNGRSEDRTEERVFESDKRINERGVISFGQTTDQIFNTYYGFKVDDNYDINPFSIELRMKSKD